MSTKRTGRRKPASLVVLEGNPGRRPVKPPIEVPAAEGIEPPGELPAGARRFWGVLAPVLQRVGLLTEADMPSLADLCMCLHRLQQAEQRIEADGLVVQGLHGPIQHPAVAIAKHYRSAAQAWAKHFGLTPLARGALDLVPKDVRDELAELLEGGRG